MSNTINEVRHVAGRRGLPIKLDAAVGMLRPTDPAPVNLVVSVPSADTKIEISGSAVITG